MSAKVTWSVIKFPEDNDAVEAVPSRWLVGNKCKWPPYPPNSKKLIEAIEKSEMPSETWQEFTIIPFRNNIYDDYEAVSLPDPPPEPAFIQKLINNVEDSSSLQGAIDSDSYQDINPNGSSSKFMAPSPICRKTQKVRNDQQPTYIEVQQPMLDKNCDKTVVHTLETPNQKEIGVKDVYNLLLRLTRKQELLQLVVTDIKESLIKMETVLLRNHQVDVETGDAESISLKFNLPIDGVEKLKEFEAYFIENEKAFKKAVHEVSQLGGKHLYDFIYRAGRTLITNSFASKFSYLGKRQKESFKILKMNNLLIESAMHLHKQATVKDVEVEISKWLKRAAERAKNEKE
ncbi:uncharacterized protein LOC116159359 [Photinus pyralis]|uniref:uncharacterized protein LOC116159359 n=2 Tax=Photinus pyralis TaxID=7054 RepID=UPI001266F6E5|nr:uncharacterized protein LOC116159359 [Photinus pyralis]XP_031328183.1 uncharacterized protein LOC116159359 [Photinus pyralis]XP_031328185.1 uncharacterized protein LOC116159359 [Photinus pyralis]